MPAKAHGERFDRLEQIVQVLAEGHVPLEKIVADPATETHRGFDRVAARFRESSREAAERSREIDERFRGADEQLLETNERIDKLASAAGGLARISYPPRN